MSPEFLALAAVAVACVLIATALDQLSLNKRRREWRAKNAWRWKKKRRDTGAESWAPRDYQLPKKLDAADQLRLVMAATFTVRPLLNKGEARLFKELDRMVIDRNPTWQVMAQVSVGEILRCQDTEAYGCINSKRVDLLLMDGDCQPRHAIEYQGAGHHQGTAAARDAVKKEALRRAGIGYHEVVAGQTTPAELRRLIEKLVDKPDMPNRPPASVS
jgi:hypothetical protein